jgi:hypothetical protein
MDPVVTQIVQNLTLAIVAAVLGLIAYGGRKLIDIGVVYVTQKIGAERVVELKEVASTFVKTLEQSPLYKDLTGEAKLEQAIVWVADYCDKHNLPYDADFVHKAVEEAVHAMNAGA